jgi:hypothetical protein
MYRSVINGGLRETLGDDSGFGVLYTANNNVAMGRCLEASTETCS